MNNFSYYFWVTILLIYIISPRDAHPLLFDDLVAAAVIYYLWQKKANAKRVRRRTSAGRYSQEDISNRNGSDLTEAEAYNLLGVKPGASIEEVKKAYMEKITGSHPDKVHHLSDELKNKAKEITLKLNNAYDIIKKAKK